MGALVMSAGLVGDHSFAGSAVIGGIKEDRDDPQFIEGELAQKGMGLEGTIVAPHSGMVPTHDKMGAAIVFSYQCMEECLPGTGIAHGSGKDPQDNSCPGVIPLEKNVVTIHPNAGRNVIFLGLAHKGVKEESIDNLKRTLLDIFVRPVNGISCLKPHDRLPPQGLEAGPGFGRSQGKGCKGALRPVVEYGDLAPDGKGSGKAPESRNSGMGGIIRPIDLLGFPLKVPPKDVRDGHEPQKTIACIQKTHNLSDPKPPGLLLPNRQHDGKGEDQTIREPHAINDRMIGLLIHETIERTHGPNGNEAQVRDLSRRKPDGRTSRIGSRHFGTGGGRGECRNQPTTMRNREEHLELL
jgi:hypothetical protein